MRRHRAEPRPSPRSVRSATGYGEGARGGAISTCIACALSWAEHDTNPKVEGCLALLRQKLELTSLELKTVRASARATGKR